MVLKCSTEKNILPQKIVLKIRRSIRVRNFAAPEEPLNATTTFFYSNPKVAPIETLWCKNHENPSDGKSHTWAPETKTNPPRIYLPR
jgi:hypothetical protein